jgi:hypothetical protein
VGFGELRPSEAELAAEDEARERDQQQSAEEKRESDDTAKERPRNDFPVSFMIHFLQQS